MRAQDIKSDQAQWIFEKSQKYGQQLKPKDIDELIEAFVGRFYPTIAKKFREKNFGEFIKHSTIEGVIKVKSFFLEDKTVTSKKCLGKKVYYSDLKF